ncbi:hypothetical protein KQX54_011940 [Cotesia glomerata]|uniref:Uncharacterized protein n=1 Tax=Cotesia glomerata TaxID=32391 RepID=A0AAV7HT34_COTGL|nr:hypothetical protein KQX54_011940 [Cotesia glomerata]
MPKRVKSFEEYSRSYRYKIIKFSKEKEDDELSMRSSSISLNSTNSNGELGDAEIQEAERRNTGLGDADMRDGEREGKKIREVR